MRICVSVDLDDYQDYQRLLDPDGESRETSFYDGALPRFLDLLDEGGLRATFFAIGRDVTNPSHRRAIREIAARGHEVGNHSHTHPYNFRRLSRREKEAEIDQCDAAISDILGARPVGFRTPSCDVDTETIELLAERGYLYDSSVLPSPLMWAFMIYGKLFVRHSEYQLGHVCSAFAPATPYFPSRDQVYRPRRNREDGAREVLEIPFSVLPIVRIPFYSTLLRRLGRRFFSVMMHAYSGRRPALLVVFHLIELAEFADTPLGRAFERTPALASPLEARQRLIREMLLELGSAGDSVTLRELAESRLGRRDADRTNVSE